VPVPHGILVRSHSSGGRQRSRTQILAIHAELDTNTYPTGVKIPDTQMNELDHTGILHRHDWHPEWNYTLNAPENHAC